MTTTTLPITITIEVTGTFVPGNLHKVRDEEPQGDTFDDLDIIALRTDDTDLFKGNKVATSFGLSELVADLIAFHREAIIEALLTAHSNSAP